MPDYAKGKIYKILNSIDDEVYVGSTAETLSQSMTRHRASQTKNPHFKLYQHMNAIGVDNFYIELIENYPCTCKYELRAKEGACIRKLGTLNAGIEGRTKQEWYDENRELLNEKIDDVIRKTNNEIM